MEVARPARSSISPLVRKTWPICVVSPIATSSSQPIGVGHTQSTTAHGTDGAVHLVDRILPLAADYRQWTLSFPRWLRLRLIRDQALASKVLGMFVRIVFAYHRRRARERDFPGGETGAVTAIRQYKFRKPDPSGRTSWVTDGPTWCRRLATLLPPRRGHTTRFHGIFASAHRLRARVVPTPAVPEPSTTAPTSLTLARRLDWAALLRRVWGPDVTTCPQCGDRLVVLALLSHPDLTAPILAHLGIAPVIPATAPARAPPDQLDLSWP